MNKHDVNIKKGKLINFQIGIIAVISFCYVMHEVSHYAPTDKKTVASLPELDNTFTTMGPVEVYVEPEIIRIKPTKVIKAEPKVEPEVKPIVVENKTEIKTSEKKASISEVKTTDKIKNNTTTKKAVKNSPAIKTKKRIHSTNSVDVMPVFPGCDKYSTNDQRAVCFQDKIQRMINNKFDRSIGNELGISGKQRIDLHFEIDENGHVTNIKARNQYPEFIKEAKRVANLLPKMEPAQRRGTKVKMAYDVPIIFKTRN